MSNANDCGEPPNHGAVCWSELTVHDVDRAQKFYTAKRSAGASRACPWTA